MLQRKRWKNGNKYYNILSIRKSASWLYHKLDGIDGNKKQTDFTDEERKQLKGALIDLADRIRRTADAID